MCSVGGGRGRWQGWCGRVRCLWVVAVGVVVVLPGCATQPYYKGYKYAPYTVRGVRYHPMHPHEAVGFSETGVASYYIGGSFWRKGRTAIGERLGPGSRAAAHKTLPLPSVVRVTNLRNGRSTVVRVNDRGPFVKGRILDVTLPVARELGFEKQGLAPVRIEVLSVGDGPYGIRKRRAAVREGW